MPLPPKLNRIAIIGDSHLGSLKVAHDEDRIAWPKGMDVEFWGASGPAFREITWSRGALRAKGEAQKLVKLINANDRTYLPAKDFDAVLFYGARLRSIEFFGPYVEWRSAAGGWPSKAVLLETARGYLISTRAYRNACEFAKSGTTAIFCPAPFPTDGVMDLTARGGILKQFPNATDLSPDDRAMLWDVLQEAALAEGVTLMPQPEDTVTLGLLTKSEYATEGAADVKDTGHKNPDFAARWMKDVISVFSAS